MRFCLLVTLFAAFVSVSPIRSAAQGAATPGPAGPAAQVEVASIRFLPVPVGGGDNWLEGEIDLDVRPDGKPVSGEFLNRVRVTLNLGYEATNTKGEKGMLFYRSTAEFITLEGGRAKARFYLPPEVVKRDKLRGEIPFYLVDIEVDGKPQPMTQAKSSKSIGSVAALKSFQTKIASEGAANDGVLMPQYLTPFAFDQRRPSPTFLRRESLR